MLLSLLAAIALGTSLQADVPPKPSTMSEILAATEPFPLQRSASRRDQKRIGNDLKKRVQRDQDLRERVAVLKSKTSSEKQTLELAKLASELRWLENENTLALKVYTEEYGWFPLSSWDWQVGRDAWIIVRNASHDQAFQRRVLATLKLLVDRQDTSLKNYAYLYDQIAAQAGVPQRWGTQGECTAQGTWEAIALEDPENLNRLRNEVSLEPFEQYADYERSQC